MYFSPTIWFAGLLALSVYSPCRHTVLCLEGACSWCNALCCHLKILNIYFKNPHVHFALGPTDYVVGPSNMLYDLFCDLCLSLLEVSSMKTGVFISSVCHCKPSPRAELGTEYMLRIDL